MFMASSCPPNRPGTRESSFLRRRLGTHRSYTASLRQPPRERLLYGSNIEICVSVSDTCGTLPAPAEPRTQEHARPPAAWSPPYSAKMAARARTQPGDASNARL